MWRLLFITCLICSLFACTGSSQTTKTVLPGAYQLEEYLPYLIDKRVGLLVNHSSIINDSHLIDTLLSCQVNIQKIFAPEHGFRGSKDAGEYIANYIDEETGIPVISLYGSNKKPSDQQMSGLDVVVFDLQDVGVRFYTYISTLHYIMEACAEHSIPLIVLDRPNPNGDYFDGPVLDMKYKSFVGMHPIPVVHGLTVGELANMINNESWLSSTKKCDLTVVKILNWNHNTKYELPVKPSPNLPNYLSVRLYPSLCFFEATGVSIGRGTMFPFQVIGFPAPGGGSFSFTPKSILGMAKNPKQKDKTCFGLDLRKEKRIPDFTISYFIDFYSRFKDDPEFKLNERWFNLLAGNSSLIKDIKEGVSENDIKVKWEEDLLNYSKLRDKYLLYSKETK